MAIINQVMVETLHVVNRQIAMDRRALDGTQTTTPSLAQQTTSTSSSPSTSATGGSGGGGTSSPLLFFVALGFGVVFTNLWIIVGVKYCFRYNARNRALRNGEDVDPINLENMPARPHRRRREKKLMSMEEVNERFPMTKYKTWVAGRASEGLPTTGGVTAPPSRAPSVRDVDGVPSLPSSPVDTKHSIDTRPATANADAAAPYTDVTKVENTDVRKSMDAKTVEVEKAAEQVTLQQVETAASTDKHPTSSSDLGDHDDDDDEDDHIHTAVPPELLTNPGDSCAICIDTLEDDDDIRGLTCGHAFHAGCLDPWLTSRRACCPLCKADYYVPKPRPEGEAETDRAGRRRAPQIPGPTAFGIRGSRGLIIPGRFIGGYPGDGTNYGQGNQRRARRARREAAAATAAGGAGAGPNANDVGAADNIATAPQSRWRPNITNPFSSMHMPRLAIPGRTRQANSAVEPTTGTAAIPAVEPSPSQLEAGTAVVR